MKKKRFKGYENTKTETISKTCSGYIQELRCSCSISYITDTTKDNDDNVDSIFDLGCAYYRRKMERRARARSNFIVAQNSQSWPFVCSCPLIVGRAGRCTLIRGWRWCFAVNRRCRLNLNLCIPTCSTHQNLEFKQKGMSVMKDTSIYGSSGIVKSGLRTDPFRELRCRI